MPSIANNYTWPGIVSTSGGDGGGGGSGGGRVYSYYKFHQNLLFADDVSQWQAIPKQFVNLGGTDFIIAPYVDYGQEINALRERQFYYLINEPVSTGLVPVVRGFGVFAYDFNELLPSDADIDAALNDSNWQQWVTGAFVINGNTFDGFITTRAGLTSLGMNAATRYLGPRSTADEVDVYAEFYQWEKFRNVQNQLQQTGPRSSIAGGVLPSDALFWFKVKVEARLNGSTVTLLENLSTPTDRGIVPGIYNEVNWLLYDVPTPWVAGTTLEILITVQGPGWCIYHHQAPTDPPVWYRTIVEMPVKVMCDIVWVEQ